MNILLSRSSNALRSGRHPARFPVGVEGLESRLALAAGITGTPLTVFSQVAGQPIATPDPTNPDLPLTSGRPVPLVSLSGTTGALVTPGFAATVNWGDGSPLDAATIVPQPDGTLTVEGPDHTYATPSTYLITVAVREPGDATVTPFQTLVSVAAPYLPLSGQLAASSNSGASLYEGITTTATPTFTGLTQPGAQVTVLVGSATNTSKTPTPIGSTIADAAGNWSVTSRKLKVGTYDVTAQAVGEFGVTTSTPVRTNVMVPTDPYSYINTNDVLVINAAAATKSGHAVGPTVSSFRVTNAQQGTFQITFTDANPTGLSLAPLTLASNYTATLATGPRSSQALGVADLTSNALVYSPVPVPFVYSDVTVSGQISTGTGTGRLPRNATITLTVSSNGIIDVAGNALNGEYKGKYPTGNGTPGGDYQVRITIRNGRVASLAPVPTAKVVAKVSRATGHHT